MAGEEILAEGLRAFQLRGRRGRPRGSGGTAKLLIADGEVLVDGEEAGTAPGLIEDIPRGSHIVEFRKYRYFPQSHKLDIVGLGQTQEIEVQLDPAWGLMQIHSEPAGAEVLVDGENFHVIRERETREDLIRGESIPEGL